MSLTTRTLNTRTLTRLLGVTSALALLAALPLTAQASPTNPEAARTDRVETSLDWTECPRTAALDYYPGMEPASGVVCATAKVPLDYDEPEGATVELFVAKHPARNPEQRIGSLFVNPGGPGPEASHLALLAEMFYGEPVLDRFDIVAMDPRGTGLSTPVVCHPSTKTQQQQGRGFSSVIPLTSSEQAGYLNSAKDIAKGCAKEGQPLASAMSTAQVARDMDVLRRAVGDDQLSYLGQSYGSYLGQLYANMFPDRVRALAIDGVLDPVAWAGTPGTAHEPMTLRLGAAEGAWEELQAAFGWCPEGDAATCAARAAERQATFDRVVERVKQKPVPFTDPWFGEVLVGYGMFIDMVHSALYAPDAPDQVAALLEAFDSLTDPSASSTETERARVSAKDARKQAKEKQPKLRPHIMDGYDQMFMAHYVVLCTDSLNPKAQKDWAPAIAARGQDAPHFSAMWGWRTAPCASQFWTATDEDGWRGPFTNHTSAPVLVVGNRYDPATPYSGAVAASRLLPNSALLTVEMFGHTSYLSNACATEAIEDYLVSGTPTATSVCAADAG